MKREKGSHQTEGHVKRLTLGEAGLLEKVDGIGLQDGPAHLLDSPCPDGDLGAAQVGALEALEVADAGGKLLLKPLGLGEERDCLLRRGDVGACGAALEAADGCFRVGGASVLDDCGDGRQCWVPWRGVGVRLTPCGGLGAEDAYEDDGDRPDPLDGVGNPAPNASEGLRELNRGTHLHPHWSVRLSTPTKTPEAMNWPIT